MKIPLEVQVHPDAERVVLRSVQAGERTSVAQSSAIRFIGLGLFAVAVGMLFLGARIGALIQAERRG